MIKLNVIKRCPASIHIGLDSFHCLSLVIINKWHRIKILLFCFLFYRKSGQRAIEELQRTLVEVETRYKSEISRLKKKYETDIRELEAALDNANRANAEYLKQIKSLQARNKVRLLHYVRNFFFNWQRHTFVHWSTSKNIAIWDEQNNVFISIAKFIQL